MARIKFSVFLCFIFLSFSSKAQNAKSNKLSVSYHWEFDSLYVNTPGKISLIIKNTGSTDLNENKWKLYFNSYKFPQLRDSSIWRLHHVNGDYYYLQLHNQSTKVLPDKSIAVNLNLNEFRNETDIPGGLYMVFDENKAVGIPLKYAENENSVRPFEKKLFEKIYYQNELVKPESNPAVKIFPTPSKMVLSSGKPFLFKASIPIKSDPEFKQEAQLLSQELKLLTTSNILYGKLEVENAIVLKKIDLPDEAYQLDINVKQITIAASSSSGIFYGIQSLKTLLPAKLWEKSTPGVISLPALKVYDEPRFKNRALIIDVARNFKSKKEILKVLDVMGLYKLNSLHMHLNDDEGWRLEIPGLPELTEIGSKRGHTNTELDCLIPSHNSGPDVANSYGTGFYTKKDYIDILKYAWERHISVIPEIETPGHARAAIKSMYARYIGLNKSGQKKEAAYYLLQDLHDQSVYHSVQGWNDNVIDITLPSAYHFIEKVSDEIVKMYAEANAPLNTIHFGGDETPKGVWDKSPSVIQFYKDHNQIKTAADLWQYYFTNVNNILSRHHLYLSGWEEVGIIKKLKNTDPLIPDLSKAKQNYHLDVWNNIIGTGMEDMAYKLANNGYKILLTNVTNLYFDMPYTSSFYEPGYYWAGYVDIDKPYYFNPLNYYKNVKEDELERPVNLNIFKNKVLLTDSGKRNIMGLQGAIWGEGIQTDQRLEYMLLPKLLSLAERAWAKEPQWSSEKDSVKSSNQYLKDWSDYINIVSQQELPRLDYYSGGYSYHIPDPGILCNNGKIYANTEYPGFIIRFTTNGTEPNSTSTIYDQAIRNNGNVRFKVFNLKGRGGKSIKVSQK